MYSFEEKVSEIFDEIPKLRKRIPTVIRQLFNESESEYKRSVINDSIGNISPKQLELFDILFIDYHFKELDGTFMRFVADNYADRFDEKERAILQAQAESYLDFYEVQEVIEGKGSYIKSLFTDREGFMKDISSSKQLTKWDIILSRVYPLDGNILTTGAATLFRSSDRDFIKAKVNELFSQYKKRSNSDSYRNFAKNNWANLRKISTQMYKSKSYKKIYTKYGEVQICEVRWKVHNFNSILDIIDEHKDFDFFDSKKKRDKKKRIVTRYQFDWITLGIEDRLKSIEIAIPEDSILIQSPRFEIDDMSMSIELLGRLFIDPNLCRLEINSVGLAEYAITYFKEIFGDALTVKRLLKKKIDPSKLQEEQSQPEPNQEINAEMLIKFLTAQYLKTLDENIPVLKDLTPRQARRDPLVLPLLIDWLKGLENFIARDPRYGNDKSIINMLKTELDIDY